MLPPEDAQYYTEGIHYKVGLKGWIFQWINGEWIRSTRSITSIINGDRAYRKEKTEYERRLAREKMRKRLEGGNGSSRAAASSKDGKRMRVREERRRAKSKTPNIVRSHATQSHRTR